MVQAGIGADLKESVARILDENGLDISTAIRMFFAKIEHVGGIPFDVRITMAHDFPSRTVLSSSDFDQLRAALEETLPVEARALLDRRFE